MKIKTTIFMVLCSLFSREALAADYQVEYFYDSGGRVNVELVYEIDGESRRVIQGRAYDRFTYESVGQQSLLEAGFLGKDGKWHMFRGKDITPDLRKQIHIVDGLVTGRKAAPKNARGLSGQVGKKDSKNLILFPLSEDTNVCAAQIRPYLGIRLSAAASIKLCKEHSRKSLDCAIDSRIDLNHAGDTFAQVAGLCESAPAGLLNCVRANANWAPGIGGLNAIIKYCVDTPLNLWWCARMNTFYSESNTMIPRAIWLYTDPLGKEIRACKKKRERGMDGMWSKGENTGGSAESKSVPSGSTEPATHEPIDAGSSGTAEVEP